MLLSPSLGKTLISAGILAAFIGIAYQVERRPMDFRVYHAGASGVFDGTRPVYGETSGLGWPMHYRYPPLFLLLFAPFTLFPLGTAAVIWLILKVFVLFVLVRELLKIPVPARGHFLITVLLAGPYVIEEFRYGNAQFFIFALAAAGLLLSRRRPVLAAGSLALAVSIKVWPLFFIPYLAVRRDWKVVGCTLGFVAVLALLPSIYFGIAGNLNLLGQWFAQESHTQLGESEIWFPNQSLRGVLMRYLTVIDYSQVPDSNYPQVNFAAFNPADVRLVWMLLAGAVYGVFLVGANRRRNDAAWLDHGLGFCLLALLEPFTQKYALAVLLWPAIVAAGAMKDARARVLIYIGTILVLIQPLAPGAGAQRFLQVLGLDFFATLMLAAALLIFRRTYGSVTRL